MKMRKRLVSAARYAIRMRSKEKNRVQALALLRKDLINGPRHCFGIHTHCSPDFCTTVRDLQVQQLPTTQQPPSSSGDTEDGEIMMTMRMISILEVNQNTYKNIICICQNKVYVLVP